MEMYKLVIDNAHLLTTNSRSVVYTRLRERRSQLERPPVIQATGLKSVLQSSILTVWLNRGAVSLTGASADGIAVILDIRLRLARAQNEPSVTTPAQDRDALKTAGWASAVVLFAGAPAPAGGCCDSRSGTAQTQIPVSRPASRLAIRQRGLESRTGECVRRHGVLTAAVEKSEELLYIWPGPPTMGVVSSLL